MAFASLSLFDVSICCYLELVPIFSRFFALFIVIRIKVSRIYPELGTIFCSIKTLGKATGANKDYFNLRFDDQSERGVHLNKVDWNPKESEENSPKMTRMESCLISMIPAREHALPEQ